MLACLVVLGSRPDEPVAASVSALEQAVDPAAATSPATTPSTTAEEEDHQGFLYGRITTDGGATYEGRLRWGGDEEAFWGDYFNGFKDENPWVAYMLKPGDLGEGNAGMLIFVDGRQRPEYLPWTDVEQVDLDRPPASDRSLTAIDPPPDPSSQRTPPE